VSFEVSRRNLLGYGALGFGGLLFGLPGCAAQSDANGGSAAAATDGSFLAQYDALATTYAGNIPALIGARAKLVTDWLNNHYVALFAELRAKRPVLHTGGPVPTLVALHSDVTEVLDTNDVYAVLPYQAKAAPMLGWFTLADPNLTRHDAEKAVFVQAMPSADDPALVAMIKSEAEGLIAEVKARGDGKIDIVQDFARRLPVKIVDKVLGVPSGSGGPDFAPTEAQMYDWIARLFRHFFLNLAGTPGDDVTKSGEQAGQELLDYLKKLVAWRKGQLSGAAGTPTDVLGRFIVMQSKYSDILSDDRIVMNICGIITGAVVTVEKSIANIVDVILDPKWKGVVVGGVMEAAGGSDNAKLWAYALEALRFNPQGIAIPRVVTAPTKLGGIDIPAGTLVLAAHPSAMMTESVFPKPDQFSVDPSARKPENYLHFGYHRYECLGKGVTSTEIAEALRALFSLPKLRLIPGNELVYKDPDPYPETFVLAYG
jgi:cytochrome P450